MNLREIRDELKAVGEKRLTLAGKFDKESAKLDHKLMRREHELMNMPAMRREIIRRNRALDAKAAKEVREYAKGAVSPAMLWGIKA